MLLPRFIPSGVMSGDVHSPLPSPSASCAPSQSASPSARRSTSDGRQSEYSRSVLVVVPRFVYVQRKAGPEASPRIDAEVRHRAAGRSRRRFGGPASPPLSFFSARNAATRLKLVFSSVHSRASTPGGAGRLSSSAMLPAPRRVESCPPGQSGAPPRLALAEDVKRPVSGWRKPKIQSEAVQSR